MPPEETDASKKPLIFISHSSKDKLIADAICARLENQGIRCWIAPRDVNPGRDYSDQIQEALERSTVIVMVLSSGSNSSRHVKSEIDRAFSLGNVIVPFRVENIELDKGLAYYLAKTHWLDAVSPPLEQHIDRLAATIYRLANPEAPPPTPPQPQSIPAKSVTQTVSDKKFLLFGLGVAGLLAILGVVAVVILASQQFFTPPAKPGVVQQQPNTSSPAPGPDGPQGRGNNAAPDGSQGRGNNTAETPALAATPVATAAAKSSVQGAWTIAEARTLEGSAYGGTVQFFKQQDRYQVTWQTAAGNYAGVGLTRGNKVCVGWSEHSFGVVFYKINGDGTMSGTWTVSGAPLDQPDGVEKATGGKPGELEGEYSVIGTNPGSTSRYGGKLKITRTGETYRMQWNVNGSYTNGVAIKVDNDLFAAFGGKDHPYGVVSYAFEGESAKGLWTLGGESQIGKEDLVKQ